jgi:hypothetical protein
VEFLAPQQGKKHRGEMMRNIDADYYGYMDDDDGLLIPVEEKCEKEAIKKKVEEWKSSGANDVDVDEAYVLPEMDVSSLILRSFLTKFSFSPMMKIMLLVDHRVQLLT